jgi:hypothetical protein
MQHANEHFRRKAALSEAALSAITPDLVHTIVSRAGSYASSGNPKAVNSFLRLLHLFGVGSCDPDEADKHEVKTLAGTPTKGLLRRMRPRSEPKTISDENVA